jgi:hypothetical protein
MMNAEGLLALALVVSAPYLAGAAVLVAVLYVCYPVRLTTILYWTAATVASWANLLLTEHVGMWREAMGWPTATSEPSLNFVTPWLLVVFFLAPIARRIARKPSNDSAPLDSLD